MAQKDIPVPIVGGSDFGVDPKINARKTYNMFESDGWMVCYSGWKKALNLVTAAAGSIEGRGLFYSTRGNIAVAVINSSVWRVDTTVGAQFIGNIATFSGPVFMDENLSAQIGIVDGLNLYIYNRSTNALITQESVTDGGTVPDDLTPNYICFHNTYFLIGNGNTTGNGSRWYAFQFTDANTVSVANGGQLALQTKPDYAKAICRLSEKGNYVLVFGKTVTELQVNSPIVQNNQIILYQRNTTINIDYGVLSVATIASSDNIVVWLAANEKSPPVIMYFDGKSHNTISSDGINYLLQRLNNPSKSVGFIYKQDGHVFYQITFYDPTDNTSLLYDFNSKKFFNVSDAYLNFHPARQVIYAGTQCFFCSLNNGAIYEISTDFTTYDENIRRKGAPLYDDALNHVIPRQIIGETFRVDSKASPFIIDNFFIVMKQGMDTTWTQFSNNTGDDIITEDNFLMVSEEDDQLITETGGTPTIIPSNNTAINPLPYQPRVDFSFSINGGDTYGVEVDNIINFVGYRQNIMQWNRLARMNEFTPKLKFWGLSKFVVGNGQMQVRQ